MSTDTGNADTRGLDTSTDPASGAAAAPPLLVLRDLRFAYPGAAGPALLLDRLEVQAGEPVFVRGPSGSGKTTLLSLLAGVLVASSGDVRFLGSSWAALAPAARDRLRADHVGYVFQQFNLLAYLPVLDNVLLPCRFSAARAQRAGGSAGRVRDTGLALLSRMGLGAADARRETAALSVGQQQRVAAARALIGKPALVIADEPTSALDEELRESFMQVLQGACAEAGSALVFVSHDSRLASRFARVVDLVDLNRAATRGAGEPLEVAR